MRTAVIRNADNLVVNVIEANEGFTIPDHTLIATDAAGIGDTYNPGNGTFTKPAAPPPPVPVEVEGWRGRAVMALHGLDGDIRSFIAAIPDAQQRTIASIGYETADAFRRDGPLLNTILTALGKTQADIDGYFIEAKALPN